MKWMGPFTVVRVVNQVAYQIRLPDGWRIHDVIQHSPDFVQVEALLDRTGGQAPLIDYVASQFESLGYHSWAHRVISSAGSSSCQTPCAAIHAHQCFWCHACIFAVLCPVL